MTDSNSLNRKRHCKACNSGRTQFVTYTVGGRLYWCKNCGSFQTISSRINGGSGPLGHTSPDLIELARNVCRDVTVPNRAVERLAKAIRYEDPLID